MWDVMATAWLVWKERNDRIFRGKCLHGLRILNQINSFPAFWVVNLADKE